MEFSLSWPLALVCSDLGRIIFGWFLNVNILAGGAGGGAGIGNK